MIFATIFSAIIALSSLGVLVYGIHRYNTCRLTPILAYAMIGTGAVLAITCLLVSAEMLDVLISIHGSPILVFGYSLAMLFGLHEQHKAIARDASQLDSASHGQSDQDQSRVTKCDPKTDGDG